MDLSSVRDEQLWCVIVCDEEGAPAGCVALLFQENGSAEIKRVYIRPQYRGKKLGKQIVSAIEKIALENNSLLLRPETGVHQHPAVALYSKCG